LSVVGEEEEEEKVVPIFVAKDFHKQQYFCLSLLSCPSIHSV
jgi:hypothetical protein